MAQEDCNPTRRRTLSVDEYFNGVRSRDVAVLARAITLFESRNPQDQLLAEELLTRLMPCTGGATRVGITGTPGAGKSTFIEALGTLLVKHGRRVAVLTIDPSSGITGGSILGDKTRMPNLAAESNAYIRPSPSAGTLGGVARKTREALLVCEAAGFDVVLIETVGVGQSESYAVHMTDCFLALLLPGAGDELQGIKRGLLELVDVLAVNKADGAMKTAAELSARQHQSALDTLSGRAGGDAPVVLTCSALEGTGVDAVWQAIEMRVGKLRASGQLEMRRRKQNLHWLWSIVQDRLRQSLHHHPAVQAIKAECEADVLSGTVPAEVAARRILDAFREQGAGSPEREVD
jgi:LAO/AO transport system kinase